RVAQTMSQARREPFTFTSAGNRLAGVLYLPAEQVVAAVGTTRPLTSVKEHATGAHARALAGRGFAAGASSPTKAAVRSRRSMSKPGSRIPTTSLSGLPRSA